jgi:hypothetical protein
MKISKRFIEFFPALSIWLTMIGLAILSWVLPVWAVYFVMIFVIYWIVRLFYMMVWLILSWQKYRKALKTDWRAELKGLDKDYREYYHVILYPTLREPLEVIERSFDQLLAGNYDSDRYIVVLSGEEIDEDNFNNISKKIREKYGNKFFKLLTTVHHLAPDELQGKGSNVHHMELETKKLIDELEIDYEKVIVSCFDIETLPSEQYFSYLTYKYLTHKNPTRVSYQPLILYNNNIWESNPVIRVVASATTFWLLTDLSRPEKLLTFSSHSMSFQMLVDVGFHDKTIVTEDSRICLQGLVRYDGDYGVEPMFVTLSMDTVYIGTFWKSFKNQYKQMRRWAWGVEHFPWMWENFFGKTRNKRIPVMTRLRYLWNQFEGMYSWATAPLIILLVGRLPLWLASDADRATAFFQNAPRTLEVMMSIGMVGLILNSVMYTLMLPKIPKKYGSWNYIVMLIQWALFPITMVIFGSIPAFDAQSRLFLGGKWRIGFWVTEKKL